MAGNNGGSPLPFAQARTVAGLAFAAAACLIAIIDALRPEVEVDGFQFFLLCGTAGLLLGVQGIERFMKP